MIASGADQMTSFEPGRVVPFGIVLGVAVRLPVFPGEEHRQRHHRDDDQQHQDRGYDDQVALLGGDVAGGVHHHHAAAVQKQQHRQEQDKSCTVFFVIRRFCDLESRNRPPPRFRPTRGFTLLAAAGKSSSNPDMGGNAGMTRIGKGDMRFRPSASPELLHLLTSFRARVIPFLRARCRSSAIFAQNRLELFDARHKAAHIHRILEEIDPPRPSGDRTREVDEHSQPVLCRPAILAPRARYAQFPRQAPRRAGPHRNRRRHRALVGVLRLLRLRNRLRDRLPQAPLPDGRSGHRARSIPSPFSHSPSSHGRSDRRSSCGSTGSTGVASS